MVAFADLDASPTKAWLVTNWNDPAVRPFAERELGQRPAEELYDLGKDPHQLQNVAADPAYADEKAKLASALIQILETSGDPRVTEKPVRYEGPPFAGE